jgi:hypothetical protein
LIIDGKTNNSERSSVLVIVSLSEERGLDVPQLLNRLKGRVVTRKDDGLGSSGCRYSPVFFTHNPCCASSRCSCFVFPKIRALHRCASSEFEISFFRWEDAKANLVVSIASVVLCNRSQSPTTRRCRGLRSAARLEVIDDITCPGPRRINSE